MLRVLVDNKMPHLYRSSTVYYIVTDIFLLFMPEVFILVSPVICWFEDDQNSVRNM